MGVEWKKTVPVFALVLLTVLAGVVVAVATRESRPDIVGIYTGQNGGEIKLAEDGTFTEITQPVWGSKVYKAPNHYWVSGNSITIGWSKSRLKGPPTFKVEGNNRLVGWDTVWDKQLVEPNRPSSLVGTYAFSDNTGGLMLSKNGAAYDTQRDPSGVLSGRVGTWVAGKDTVTVTYPDLQMKNTLQTTYTINGKNLVGGGKELVKKSDDAIVPAMP